MKQSCRRKAGANPAVDGTGKNENPPFVLLKSPFHPPFTKGERGGFSGKEGDFQTKGLNGLRLKYDKDGLIPAIIQDYKTKKVLMLAYMNRVSLKKTIELGRTCFWSRSRRVYWIKGQTSGHFQFVKEISYDCDKDALLIKVRQVEGACHTGNQSCFYRRLIGKSNTKMKLKTQKLKVKSSS